jgi:hypothetical protein
MDNLPLLSARSPASFWRQFEAPGVTLKGLNIKPWSSNI